MSALTEGRNTPMREGTLYEDPVAAATTLYEGGLACLDASGNLVPGSVATTLTARGRVEERADNSGGSAGDINGKTRAGVFKFANDSTTAVARADIGGDCYILDDQTVSGDGTGRSVAGTVVQVDSDGVWVKVGV